MLTMEHILRRAYPVLPVLVIDDVERAVSLAQALCAGGINVIEVTLRTPQALEALKVIRQEVPDLIVGAVCASDGCRCTVCRQSRFY